MARNDVWRYTLRLFHTFALFETNREIDAKREPNNFFWMKNDPSGAQGLIHSSILAVF